MKIEAIYPPYIYSIKYDDQKVNEFERLLEEWRDLDKMIAFFEENSEYLKADIWAAVSEPEAAVDQVANEADDLEILLSDLFNNAESHEQPDFDDYFKYLNGRYRFDYEYVPMKSYGRCSPSLIRLYAIKLKANLYIITGGGVKLCKTIQESPGLKDHVMQNIMAVKSWLKDNDIYTEEEFIN